jgi:hypothetical protein
MLRTCSFQVQAVLFATCDTVVNSGSLCAALTASSHPGYPKYGKSECYAFPNSAQHKCRRSRFAMNEGYLEAVC